MISFRSYATTSDQHPNNSNLTDSAQSTKLKTLKTRLPKIQPKSHLDAPMSRERKYTNPDQAMIELFLNFDSSPTNLTGARSSGPSGRLPAAASSTWTSPLGVGRLHHLDCLPRRRSPQPPYLTNLLPERGTAGCLILISSPWRDDCLNNTLTACNRAVVIPSGPAPCGSVANYLDRPSVG